MQNCFHMLAFKQNSNFLKIQDNKKEEKCTNIVYLIWMER